MARELRRLLIAPERLEAAATADGGALPVLMLAAEERRYLTRVLRYGPDDAFAVIDGAGRLWSARLLSAERARLEQPLAEPLQQQAPSLPRLVLAAAVVKRDFEVVVRMAVELGVDCLIPLLCERTAVQGRPRAERWRSIAAEAAEQCERLWLPQIEEPQALKALLLQHHPLRGGRFWATTRREALAPLSDRLGVLNATDAGEEIWLACGPEGGWSPAEEGLAVDRGWQPVSLGANVLRSSTACVAGVAALSGWRQSCSAPAG